MTQLGSGCVGAIFIKKSMRPQDDRSFLAVVAPRTPSQPVDGLRLMDNTKLHPPTAAHINPALPFVSNYKISSIANTFELLVPRCFPAQGVPDHARPGIAISAIDVRLSQHQ